MARKKAWSGWGRPMQRVAGWDFDHRLNGYVTTAADRFACECGDEFDTPSGYRKCGSCGRAWNSYVIGTDGHGREASLEKVICREIPVRKDVIVASKRPRKAKWLGPIDFGGKMNNHDNYAYSDDDDRFMGPTESVVSYPPELTPAGHGTRPRMKRTKVKNPEDYPPPRGEGRHRAEARRRQAGIECVNGCGNLKAPPAIDWSMSKGIPFDMNTKWQYYYETGGDHPHNYDEDFEIPGNWDSFNSWHGSGYCQDCHPYKNGHPNPEHPGYNKWLQDNRSHPGRDEPDEKRSGWDPDKDQDPFDPRLIGASRRQAKGDCECWDGYERVPGTKPCAKGSCRKKAALRYVAWCRQVGRRPSPAGLRRFKVAERIVRTAQFRIAADEPFRDVEYSPGVWRGIHHHYPYPDRIPHIYDYEQFRKDNPDWFNPDGSPNPPPMRDSNPWSPSSRKLAPPMNMSPRSRYQAPNVHPEYGWINDVYRRLSEDEIKQHWPEVPRDQWTGYPGAVRFPGNEYHEPTHYSAGMAADPGLYKVYEPGWETGVAPQKSKPSAMPRKIKPRPGDPSSAESGLTLAKRRRADRHNLRRRDLAELEAEQEPEEDVSIEHFSSRRRRAELFDITEEGETRKGKGKTDTPTMRKNPKDWTDRRQNGQYTKRWN